MREIKFRGLSGNGHWVYGYYVYASQGVKHKLSTHSKHWIVCEAFGNGGYFNATSKVYIKHAETIGQFTGLHDKNGKEVYEGDVIRHGFNFFGIGKVVFDECGFYFESLDSEIMNDGYIALNNECEVIGNIYENPELMEQK